MAVIRNPTDLNDPVNYVATIAFFCCVSCVVLMLRFKFKAKLNIAESVNYGEVAIDKSNTITGGGYRFQKDEFFGLSESSYTSIKVMPPVAKPPKKKNPALRPAKSANDLNRAELQPVTSSKSTSDISLVPGGNNDLSNNVQPENPMKTAKDLKKEEKERKKLEKKQIAEQKAKRKANRDLAKQKAKKAHDRAKIEAKKAQDHAKVEAKKTQGLAKIEAKKAQDHAKIEAMKAQDHAKIEAKMAQDHAKIEAKKATDHANIEAVNAKRQAKIKAKEELRKTPVASERDLTPRAPPASAAPNRIEVVQTISIQSDINRNSGPPPYSEFPTSTTNENKVNRNTSFSKPIQSSSSWDMISQHRQQINRPSVNVGAVSRKQVVMDLQYKSGSNESDPENSEA